VGTSGAGRLEPNVVLKIDAARARGAGASTVVLNVTATEALAGGWMRVWSCTDPQPSTSSVNFVPGRTTANAVVVNLGAKGICMATSAPVHLLADVTGWFTDSNDIVASAPNRLVDTRIDGQMLRGGEERRIMVAGTPGINTGATMAALNLTVDAPSKTGWLVAYPCGQPTPSSTLNWAAGDTAAALTFVALADGFVCVRSVVDVQLIVDASGWSSGAATLKSLPPQRVLDTRDPNLWPGGIAQHVQTLSLRVAGRGGVPNNAAAAVLTVTVADSTGTGYVTVWPCDQPMPATSTINTWPGVLRSNLAMVGLAADGTVCLRQYTNEAKPLNLIVDAVGYSTGGPERAPAPPVGGGVATTGPNLQGGLRIPASSASEPTGNFRTICGFSHFAYDDPIVYPNQPGASHLHMFFGNTATNASSTYDSLRSTGDGSCQGGPLNRSGYWSPALHNADGNLLIPDFITVYYKGNGPSAAQIASIRAFPAGLRMIAGYDMNLGGDQFGSAHFDWTCETTQHPQGTIPSCPAGERIGVRLAFPNCWDGVNLDSANHRSHLAYGTWEGTGKWHCPSGYPVILPEYSIGIWYQNDGNSANWYLDSDRMPGMTHANGSTFHADWFGAWEPDVMNTWVSRCINGLLNCIDGEIGDGRKLVGGWTYTGPKLVAPIARPA
jgi:hypothetical protein